MQLREPHLFFLLDDHHHYRHQGNVSLHNTHFLVFTFGFPITPYWSTTSQAGDGASTGIIKTPRAIKRNSYLRPLFLADKGRFPFKTRRQAFSIFPAE